MDTAWTSRRDSNTGTLDHRVIIFRGNAENGNKLSIYDGTGTESYDITMIWILCIMVLLIINVTLCCINCKYICGGLFEKIRLKKHTRALEDKQFDNESSNDVEIEKKPFKDCL